MDINNISTILTGITHPEYEKDIVALEMVENLKVENNKVSFRLVFKRPHDPVAASLKNACEQAIFAAYPDASVSILMMVKEGEAKKKKKTPEEASGLNNVRHIIAITSGKGGVGKSTVSVNLAATLANMGYSVGLVDADVYGPSIPKMLGIEDAKPALIEVDGEELIEPISSHGILTLSIGFFVDPESPLIWRGPLSTSALRQLTKQGAWGNLDYLLIDLPPGTGDIHLSITSELKLSGAIVVSTPQPVALADAIKGINMYKQESINVPILGLVENMAWFTPEELPNNRYYIFGKEGCRQLAERLNVPLLGEVPIIQSIREGADDGKPNVLNNATTKSVFEAIAKNMIKQLEANS